jgi:enoyl-CoA hydratase
MSASEELVLVSQPFEGCAVLALNRPQAANALSLALRRELVQAIERCEADPSVRVLVLTGNGKAFCAGLDLKELGAAADPSAALASAPHEDPVLALRRFSGPVIAAVNGVAVTGGFELALNCDILLASTHARFADTHVRVGVMPGWGLSQLLPRLIGSCRAKELSLTGNFLDAQQAEAWGLVNRVVAPEQLLPQALQLARDMLSAQPDLLLQYKRLIDDGLQGTLAAGLALESQRSRAWASQVQATSIANAREGIRARGREQAGAAGDGGSSAGT